MLLLRPFSASSDGYLSLEKSGGCKMNQPTVMEIIDRLKSVLNGKLTRRSI